MFLCAAFNYLIYFEDTHKGSTALQDRVDSREAYRLASGNVGGLPPTSSILGGMDNTGTSPTPSFLKRNASIDRASDDDDASSVYDNPDALDISGQDAGNSNDDKDSKSSSSESKNICCLPLYPMSANDPSITPIRQCGQLFELSNGKWYTEYELN